MGIDRGLRRVQHGGDWIGYHAAYARYPEQHTSVIVLCNSDGISPEGLDDRVADIVLAKAFTAPKPNAEVDRRAPTTQSGGRPTTTLAGGYFASSTGEVFRVVTHDSGLVLEIVGQSFPLKPPRAARVPRRRVSHFHHVRRRQRHRHRAVAAHRTKRQARGPTIRSGEPERGRTRELRGSLP